MIVIVCVDDNNGMTFNHRRQSKDKILREHILQMAGEKRIWMNAYSRKQFSECETSQIVVDEDYPEKADRDDYCFVEDKDISGYIERIEKIILFKWNRKYPADTFFSLNLEQWRLEESEDFEGNSHEKITKEIYVK